MAAPRPRTRPDLPGYDAIVAALAPLGLIARGGFAPAAGDGVPGDPTTLVMVGNAGPAMWRVFAEQRPAGGDAMNRWTRQVVDKIAADLGARTLYPFDGPPWHPFQRWAQRADPVFPSPIGMLVHPRLRALARLSRGARLRSRGRERAGTGGRAQPLRDLRRPALPYDLPGRRLRRHGLRCPRLRRASSAAGGKRLHDDGLPRPARLPCGSDRDLSAGAGGVPYGRFPRRAAEGPGRGLFRADRCRSLANLIQAGWLRLSPFRLTDTEEVQACPSPLLPGGPSLPASS